MSDLYTNNPRANSTILPSGVAPSSLDSSDISRVLPRQVSTGTMRGTQNVGYGNVKIDGSNNTITVGSVVINGETGTMTTTAKDGSAVGIGLIPESNGENGFFSLDKNGKLIMKIVNGTKYVYNPADSYKNVTQDGLLPDASGGFVVAKPGYNVSDIFL